jgi:Tfp pilus assembly protein PilP
MTLGSNHSSPKIVTTLAQMFFIIALLAVTSIATAVENGKPGPKNRKAMLNNFFKSAGVEQIAYRMDHHVFDGPLAQSQFPSGQIMMIKNMMNRVYEPEEWLRSIRNRMLVDYQPRHMKQLVKWYQSPLGKKVVQVETMGMDGGMVDEKKRYLSQLEYYPPKESRLEIAERLETTLGMTDYTLDAFLVLTKVLFPYHNQWEGTSARKVSQNIKENNFEPAREYFLKSFLFKFRNLSDKELAQYATFATSPAGKWFYRSYFRGSRDSLEKTSVELKHLLDSIQQEMRSGGESVLLKEIAPPGQRFLFIRMRDPFVPLVDPKQGLIQLVDEDESELEFRKFADELKSLPQIPMEVFRNIKSSDPRLYADLEHFGGLFSQETKIASMNEDDYLNTVKKYKTLINKANDTKPGMIVTPIQTEYEGIKLVGVIWKNNETIALVETDGNKGHSVKEGDLLGPNFGVVEKISNNQLLILEQSRDYLGNILSNKKQLEIINEAPEEG